jgi:hypothetical protein
MQVTFPGKKKTAFSYSSVSENIQRKMPKWVSWNIPERWFVNPMFLGRSFYHPDGK